MIPSLHTWVTRRVLRQCGAHSRVQGVVGETVRWPDWYWWASNPSHASTPADERGVPADSEQSRMAAVARCREYVQRLGATKSLEEKTLWLGAILHWTQDLAVHQGRTNPEHSWQSSLLLPNPDWNPAGIKRGLQYSRQVIEALVARPELGLQKLFTEGQLSLPSADLQKQLLGERTFQWRVLWDFGVVGWRVGRTAPRVRWDTEKTLQEVLK